MCHRFTHRTPSHGHFERVQLQMNWWMELTWSRHCSTWPGSGHTAGTGARKVTSPHGAACCVKQGKVGEIVNLLVLLGTHGDARATSLDSCGPLAPFRSPLVVGCFGEIVTYSRAVALSNWAKVNKEESLGRSFYLPLAGLGFSGLHGSSVTSGWTRSGCATVTSRGGERQVSCLGWKRARRLWERSVSLSIFKVPSLLLRDATGGGGGCLRVKWRTAS